MPNTTLTVSRTRAVSPLARVANQSGLVAVATAAVVIAGQEPPLVAWPPLPADETPDEEEIPETEEPCDEEPCEEEPCEEEPCEEKLDWPDEVPLPEPPVRPLCGCCTDGRDGDRCANLAPTKAAAAAASSPIRQVIFLTRRRPSSLDRSADCWERFTGSGLSGHFL